MDMGKSGKEREAHNWERTQGPGNSLLLSEGHLGTHSIVLF